jgi:glycosyltransferase involved in cell wall biosynthesis
LHIHGGAFDKFYTNSDNLHKRFIRFILEKGDRIIVLSKYWKNLLVKEINVNVNKIDILNNCYSLELNKIDEVKINFGYNKRDNKIELLFVGGIGTRKGVFDLLKVSKNLRQKNYNFVLYLAGNEEEPRAIERVQNTLRHENLANHVRLLGEIKSDQKLYYFARCDFFLLLSYNENFPIVILEAMRAGLPIITTPVGAIPDFFKDEDNGFLVNPGDCRTCLEKIELLIKDEILRKNISSNNKIKSLIEFNPSIYPEKLNQIMNKI